MYFVDIQYISSMCSCVYFFNSPVSTSTILSPTSAVLLLPPKSAVLNANPPLSVSSSTFRTASSTAFACFSRPREYLNSMAALRIVPIGFAMPFPAISGAEPWIGSYIPLVVLKFGAEYEVVDGAPANDADGRRPSDPGITLDWSDKLKKQRSTSERRRRQIHQHITEKILCENHAVQFAWVSDNQHSCRVNQVVIEGNLWVFFRQGLGDDLPP